MKSSNICLLKSEIPLLLSGDLPPDEVAAAESHIAECETCRSVIESMIADSRWWDDARHSLATSAMRSADRPDVAHDSEPKTNEQMLELLGPTDDPAMLGRIGVYEIVGILGHGGMGVVFKGYDGALHRSVAIKMLLPHLAASGAARKRFAREAQAAAAVVDDHVMAIHGVSEWKSVPYFVMPYARGVSLQKRLSHNGPLEVREILRIGMQAAKGLAAAHAQGLVHRDVKPANIFLAEGVERVQLMDFGLARAVDDASLTRSGILAGTPQYMSPEQARAETVNHRSDLFSLGSVLYAMCTGHAPFRAESSYSVLRLITDKEPRPIREINPDIPDWLCAIIGKLMAKQANDRFASAREVASLLEDCLAHVQQPTTTPLPFVSEPMALAAGSVDNDCDRTKHQSPEASANGSRIRWLIATAAFAFFVFAGVLIVLDANKGTLTIESSTNDVPIRITQGDKVVKRLTVTKGVKSVRVAAGTYVVEIDGQFVGLSVQDGTVSLNRGTTEIVKVISRDVANSSRGIVHSAQSQSDWDEAVRSSGSDGKVVVDVYCGEDVMPQMNTQGPNKAKHVKLLQNLNAIEGVTCNFRIRGKGNEIFNITVRDPQHRLLREIATDNTRERIRDALLAEFKTAGIDDVRWPQVDSDGVHYVEELEAAAHLSTYRARNALERSVGKLVLVYSEDKLRRAVPCLVLHAGDRSVAVTSSPATIVPDGTPHAIDRTFIDNGPDIFPHDDRVPNRGDQTTMKPRPEVGCFEIGVHSGKW